MPIQKYSYNNSFFDQENEQSFYWAGFLAADGCVQDKKINEIMYLDSLKLRLSIKDINHLQMFARHLNSNNKITTGIVKNSLKNKKWNDTGYCDIVLYSVKLCQSLQKFNIVPRKTHIYTFPNWLIAHPLVHHFMRGYFDGDGSIEIDKSGNQRFCVRGTIDFLTEYKKILIKNCNVNDNSVNNSSGIGRVRYNGNGVCKILYNYLYKDATIFLNRKKEVFEVL